MVCISVMSIPKFCCHCHAAGDSPADFQLSRSRQQERAAPLTAMWISGVPAYIQEETTDCFGDQRADGLFRACCDVVADPSLHYAFKYIVSYEDPSFFSAERKKVRPVVAQSIKGKFCAGMGLPTEPSQRAATGQSMIAAADRSDGEGEEECNSADSARMRT